MLCSRKATASPALFPTVILAPVIGIGWYPFLSSHIYIYIYISDSDSKLQGGQADELVDLGEGTTTISWFRALPKQGTGGWAGQIIWVQAPRSFRRRTPNFGMRATSCHA